MSVAEASGLVPMPRSIVSEFLLAVFEWTGKVKVKLETILKPFMGCCVVGTKGVACLLST